MPDSVSSKYTGETSVAGPVRIPAGSARQTRAARRIFVKGLKLEAMIGLYEFEKRGTQPVIIDVDVDVLDPEDLTSDKAEDVFCYNKLCQNIRSIISEGHILLVETLAEKIANHCLDHPMAMAVRVRVNKPNAVAEADGAGVEINRVKPV